MTTIQFKSVMFLVLILLLSSSCTKDENLNNDINLSETEKFVESGIWKITYFNDSGDDETHHFAGYSFSFKANGTVNATNGITDISGSWSITHDDSSHNNYNGLEFNIHMNTSQDKFEELNEDWEIINKSNVKIELIHVSGGNGGTDYLTFELV